MYGEKPRKEKAYIMAQAHQFRDYKSREKITSDTHNIIDDKDTYG